MLYRLSFLLILTFFSSCLYRMPSDEEVHVVPKTNNPQVIGNKSENWMPGVGI